MKKSQNNLCDTLAKNTCSGWNHNYASEKFHRETFCINSTLNNSRSRGSRKYDGMLQTEGREEYNKRVQSMDQNGIL
jgi:hypothetical protein